MTEHFKELDKWAEQYSANHTDKEGFNPMIRKFGRAPEGTKCKTCEHLVRVQGNTKNYLKCEIRGITKGAGTDHRAKWNACGKWELEK